MSLIVETVMSVCILTGIYIVVSNLMDSPRILSYSKHLYEQFEKNLYEDKCEVKNKL
jgi:hypothetical protein